MVIAVMGIRLPLVVSTVGIWQLALYSTPNPFSCDTITLILFQHVSTVFCLEENVSTTKKHQHRNSFVFNFPVSQHNKCMLKQRIFCRKKFAKKNEK